MQKIIDTVKEISKYIGVLGLILYFFGFICTSAFYTSFGIVNYDLINSRYIIVGVFPLLGLGLIFFTVKEIRKNIEIKKIFFAENILKRIFSIFSIPVITYLSSFALYLLMNAGQVIPKELNSETYIKIPLFKYDFIGNFLWNLNLHNFPVALKLIVGFSVYLFFYLLLPSLLIFLWNYCTIKNKPQNIDEKSLIKNEKIYVKEFSRESAWLIALRLLELLVILFNFGVFYYSYLKLRDNILGPETFSMTQISFPLIFAWMYFSVALMGSIPAMFESFILKIKSNKEFINHNTAITFLHVAVIPIVISILYFGIAIFPRIPTAIGGGQLKEIKLKIKDGIDLFHKNSKIYFLGQASDFIFIYEEIYPSGNSYQINKDDIVYLKSY